MRRTDAVDVEFDLRAENLIPAIDRKDQVPAAIERASAAEWMSERGIGCEVSVDSRLLL